MAAIAPATAAVSGYFEKQKQLALEEQKQRHELTMSQQKQDDDIRNRYLNRLIDPGQARRTLRLLEATASDAKMREWVRSEMSYVDKEAQWMENGHDF